MPDPNIEEQTVQYVKKDFMSDQVIRWCPGCGDYSILSQVQTTFSKLGLPKESFAVVSGIGCSSRFPYYMDTYGFHSIHGRAPAIASGLKATRPDLSVWVVTGDGDGLSIGGNHIIHALRRNVDIQILLFNNRIYGLTKGQYSPTSEVGKRTKSSPLGSIDSPFQPLQIALGAGGTFLARSVDTFPKDLRAMLLAAHEHTGTAFVEIYQNCNIFNDGAFEYMTAREIRGDNEVDLQHGKPLIFGREMNKGIRLTGNMQLEVAEIGKDCGEDELIVHDEKATPASLSFLLSQVGPPKLPTALGIFRCVEEEPFEKRIHDQIASVTETQKPGELDALLNAGDTWTVK